MINFLTFAALFLKCCAVPQSQHDSFMESNEFPKNLNQQNEKVIKITGMKTEYKKTRNINNPRHSLLNIENKLVIKNEKKISE